MNIVCCWDIFLVYYDCLLFFNVKNTIIKMVTNFFSCYQISSLYLERSAQAFTMHYRGKWHYGIKLLYIPQNLLKKETSH